jgi:IS5 family transposase
MLDRHIARSGAPPRQTAADGAYASRTNLVAAKLRGVSDVAFHKKCGIAVADMVKSPWVYRRLRRFRAGIEAAISCLYLVRRGGPQSGAVGPPQTAIEPHPLRQHGNRDQRHLTRLPVHVNRVLSRGLLRQREMSSRNIRTNVSAAFYRAQNMRLWTHTRLAPAARSSTPSNI